MSEPTNAAAKGMLRTGGTLKDLVRTVPLRSDYVKRVRSGECWALGCREKAVAEIEVGSGPEWDAMPFCLKHLRECADDIAAAVKMLELEA